MRPLLAAINSRNYTGAITDGLTRLKNERYGLIRIEEAVYAVKRYKSGLGLLMCDIDHFKRVNDTYGHPAGDAVLREVSRRIAACVREERYCSHQCYQMSCRGALHRGKCDAGIERREASAMLERQRQEISVAYLPRAMYPRAVHDLRVNDGGVIGPE